MLSAVALDKTMASERRQRVKDERGSEKNKSRDVAKEIQAKRTNKYAQVHKFKLFSWPGLAFIYAFLFYYAAPLQSASRIQRSKDPAFDYGPDVLAHFLNAIRVSRSAVVSVPVVSVSIYLWYRCC